MASSLSAAPLTQPFPAAFVLPERRNPPPLPKQQMPTQQMPTQQKRPLSDNAMTQAPTASFQDLSDEDLFTKIREDRSEAAFNILYKRYDKRLYAYCLRATSSHDAAKDAFQAVMSVIFEKRESFTGGSYAAWLFTIARHHVMKVSKRQQRDLTQNKPIDDDFDDITPDTGGGINEQHDFLLQQALDRAIAQLPEDLREAFELKQYDGLHHEEIAETLGITVSLAKVRVFRAKQLLRQTLAPFIKELQ
ncbi:MAG: sigma-70 family RNA polymerase sigma factor [Candidatus Kapabacteria bacterium]|jgi:RNA polymerase sigma-70 factor (ECF subfamily)|nr:sigma-70 family RNA polymerase sigma factor [Candidatus Kapabacteria bacterium]